MRKLDWPTIGMALLWLIVIVVMLIHNKTKASDDVVTVCYTRTEQGAVFTFSNIPDTWLENGWYFIGDDVQLDDHALIVTGLQFDNGYSYAIIGRNDYSQNVTASTDLNAVCGVVAAVTPEPTENAPEPLVARNNDTPAAVVSTGRTCVVKYPEIILVCNGGM